MFRLLWFPLGVLASAPYPVDELMVGYNALGYHYRLPTGFRWSGLPHDFGRYHESSEGNLTTAYFDSTGNPMDTFFDSTGSRFRLTEATRFFRLVPVNPGFEKEGEWYNIKTQYKISHALPLGNTIKVQDIRSFNILSFLENIPYNPAKAECWDGDMRVKGYSWLGYKPFLGRLYLQTEMVLEYYPPAHLLPSKSKLYNFVFPISLENGQCDSIFA
ncbi:hypothetical protein DSO57_1027558 [Entomophthora muscae]|uniref:Uncharacterized protein n=1 Tax=Entomophthora muscae TaxID=34485 RepID=A0ACC2SF14_9FUNG|nr:hypothetical protein DSO57_1027558 [Entomophthora muscae]